MKHFHSRAFWSVLASPQEQDPKVLIVSQKSPLFSAELALWREMRALWSLVHPDFA
jgi:hypothetical protein